MKEFRADSSRSRGATTPSLAQPIFAEKALDAPELRFIVGDDGAADRHGMSGDEQIIGADGLAGSLKPGADQAVGFIGGRFERNDVKSAQNGL